MTADIDEFAKRFFAPAGGGRTRHPDGSVEFVCTGCGARVCAAIDDGFDFCVCATCRFIGERPWLENPLTRGKQAMAPATPGAQRCGSSTPALRIVAFALAAAGALAWIVLLSQGGRP